MNSSMMPLSDRILQGVRKCMMHFPSQSRLQPIGCCLPSQHIMRSSALAYLARTSAPFNAHRLGLGGRFSFSACCSLRPRTFDFAHSSSASEGVKCLTSSRVDSLEAKRGYAYRSIAAMMDYHANCRRRSIPPPPLAIYPHPVTAGCLASIFGLVIENLLILA
jgi:hypothetical protein